MTLTVFSTWDVVRIVLIIVLLIGFSLWKIYGARRDERTHRNRILDEINKHYTKK